MNISYTDEIMIVRNKTIIGLKYKTTAVIEGLLDNG